MDNDIAHGPEMFRPGKVAICNGMDYDLAGKVMEVAAGKSYYDADECILSKNTIGHGSSSCTVLRIDLDNAIVVDMGRYEPGEAYAEYFPRFLRAVKNSLE